jgi:lipopolysaccharide biosynthesis glycosyltransferase
MPVADRTARLADARPVLSPAAYAPRVIVTSGDEKYMPGLVVALASFLRRLPVGFEVDIVVYDDGLSAASQEELERIVARAPTCSRLHLKDGFSKIGHLPVARHVNQSTYSRLLIPNLPPEVERAVQFDADLLVVDDLSWLLTMDIGDAIFAACIDRDTPTVETGVPYSYETLLLPPGRQYFNAGLLVINIAAWREAEVSKGTIEYVNRWADQLRCPDQEGINAVSGDHGMVLDRRFNFQVSGEGLAAQAAGDSSHALSDLRRAAVIHFTGPKPWLNVWFSSPIWRQPAASWWREALSSPLISARTRLHLLRIGTGTLARETKRLAMRD